MSTPASLILDFDGTVTFADVGDALCDHFAPPAWRAIDERWLRGELSLPEAQRQMWALARATREQIEAHAHQIGARRAGLEELVACARSRGYRLVLASGGFDFYIRPLLGDLVASFDEIVCNSARFDDDQLTLSFHQGLECSSCAVCKGRVCERERARGARRIVFVGDGSSDRCVLACGSLKGGTPAADAIAAIAGARLARACEAAGASFTPLAGDLRPVIDLL